MAVVEFAESQSIRACKAEIPVNSSMYTVSRGSPEECCEVIGQQLELHLNADICPELLNNSNRVKQVARIVNSPDGVTAVPSGF